MLKRLRPYWLLFSGLLLGLGTLFLRVMRHVILPTRRRKGNLLSSLFVFFTGIAEQLIDFGEAVSRTLPTIHQPFIRPGVLKKTWTFSQKYLRLAVLVATWVLFVLSFFEGAGSWQSSGESVATRQEARVRDPGGRDCFYVARWGRPGSVRLSTCTILSSRCRLPFVRHSIDRWLRLCALRI